MSQSWVPPDHGSESGGLHRRVARGLKWTLIDNWGSQIVALGIFLLLASLLQPVDFGLVALAAVFVQFAQIFVDQGLGDAIIQRKSLTRTQIDTAFWIAMGTGLALTIVGIVVAGPISTLVRQPALAPILQVLSISFVLVALSSIQLALLRREMQFRSLALRRLAALACGGVVGIAAAYLGYGVWALVAQQLTSATVSVVLLWAASPWRPGFGFSRSAFRSLFSFGLNIVGGDVLAFASRNADNLLIGVFLGPTQLGFYAIGYRILDVSVTILLNAARKLAFPTLSRLQAQPDRLRSAYNRMTQVVGTITLPGYVLLALVAQEAVLVILGSKWAASGPVAAVLMLVGPVLAIQAFSGSLLNAVGRPDRTLRFQLLTTVANVTGFLVAVLVFRDIVAVAVAFVIRGYLLAPILQWLIHRYAGIRIWDNLRRLRRTVLATALMAAAVFAVKLVFAGSMQTAALLAVEVAVGTSTYVVSLLILDRGAAAETWRLATEAFSVRRGGRKAPREEAPSDPEVLASLSQTDDPMVDDDEFASA
jgi:O-antigen/teichoic acid export membrane protein